MRRMKQRKIFLKHPYKTASTFHMSERVIEKVHAGSYTIDYPFGEYIVLHIYEEMEVPQGGQICKKIY